ncbi:hydrophobin [Boletus coccyginus]|nr:hydrophobin [Boletus coccyginus]
MFARFFTLLPLALFASASHLEARDQCNTGAINCCNSVQTLNQANTLLGTFGLVDAAASAGGLVGLTCTPITVIGAGSGCNAVQQPVCCSDNQFGGLVSLGCSPINLGL